jgi:hypothetical protein
VNCVVGSTKVLRRVGQHSAISMVSELSDYYTYTFQFAEVVVFDTVTSQVDPGGLYRALSVTTNVSYHARNYLRYTNISTDHGVNIVARGMDCTMRSIVSQRADQGVS